MAERKIRIETDQAPPSTGFRSQGLIAGGILFAAGQIGAAMPQPGVLREPATDMAESVRITLNHLDQVTQAAGLKRSAVFEVDAFPKVAGQHDLIQRETVAFLGHEPAHFHYQEVHDVAMHAQIEMDWLAVADSSLTHEAAAALFPAATPGTGSDAVHSGPFVLWHGLKGHGASLGAASEALFVDLLQRLHAIGGTPEDLVRLTVYMYAFDPYPQFNEVTKRLFAEFIPPARSVLVAPEITGDAKIVIDVVALQPEG